MTSDILFSVMSSGRSREVKLNMTSLIRFPDISQMTYTIRWYDVIMSHDVRSMTSCIKFAVNIQMTSEVKTSHHRNSSPWTGSGKTCGRFVIFFTDVIDKITWRQVECDVLDPIPWYKPHDVYNQIIWRHHITRRKIYDVMNQIWRQCWNGVTS